MKFEKLLLMIFRGEYDRQILKVSRNLEMFNRMPDTVELATPILI